MKYVCKCCGCAAMDTDEEYDICPVCFWERDFYQEKNSDYDGGANSVSLEQARKNYAEYGACEEQFVKKVRPAYDNEKNTSMRRNDRCKYEDFAFDVLDRADYSVLAMTDEDGFPYCIPISLVRIDDKLYFHSAYEGKKCRAMLKNPKVCITAATDVRPAPFTTFYSSAVVRGNAALVDDDKLKIMVLKALSERFSPDAMDGFDKALDSSLKRTAIWSVEIESITAKQKS